MLGICTVLSVAASSVEWRCSTEGSTWQLEALPPQNRDHDEAPNPICNPIPNLDCWGQLNHKKFSLWIWCQCRDPPNCPSSQCCDTKAMIWKSILVSEVLENVVISARSRHSAARGPMTQRRLTIRKSCQTRIVTLTLT